MSLNLTPVLCEDGKLFHRDLNIQLQAGKYLNGELTCEAIYHYGPNREPQMLLVFFDKDHYGHFHPHQIAGYMQLYTEWLRRQRHGQPFQLQNWFYLDTERGFMFKPITDAQGGSKM